MAEGHLPLMEALLQDIGSTSAGKSLLDLGCGTGKFLALAQAAGFESVSGVDASPQMIATAKMTAPGAEVKMGAFETLPWPDQSFDQVTSIEALYYSPEPQQVFEEVARVLKLGGRFDLIIDYYAESEGTRSWAEGLGFEITRLAIADWIALAESAGFETCQSRRIIQPNAKAMIEKWEASVWYPTRGSYENYLKNGAFWLTAWQS